MRRLTHREFLIGCDTDNNHTHTLNVRGLVPLAFGRSLIAASLSYVEMDCLCLRIADTLAKSYSRKLATGFVRCHFDIIAEVLAAAEAKPDQCQYLSVIDFYNRGRKSHCMCGTLTADPEIIAFELAKIPLTSNAIVDRVTSVNITSLRSMIVADCARKGIEVDAPWLPPAGSPELAELLSSYINLRDAAIEQVQAKALEVGKVARAAFEQMIPTGAAN